MAGQPFRRCVAGRRSCFGAIISTRDYRWREAGSDLPNNSPRQKAAFASVLQASSILETYKTSLPVRAVLDAVDLERVDRVARLAREAAGRVAVASRRRLRGEVREALGLAAQIHELVDLAL